MAYTTKMESWKKVELQNAGVTIHVHKNGSKLGRLEIMEERGSGLAIAHREEYTPASWRVRCGSNSPGPSTMSRVS
jgi:hypothetical protein